MVLLSICLLLLAALSLVTFVMIRRKKRPVRFRYVSPPKDWPEIRVDALSLFQKEGRINAPMPSQSSPRVLRFQSYENTQAYIMQLADDAHGSPEITLQLSEMEGPEWTDVIVNGRVVAHVQTSALTAGRAQSPPTYH